MAAKNPIICFLLDAPIHREFFFIVAGFFGALAVVAVFIFIFPFGSRYRVQLKRCPCGGENKLGFLHRHRVS